MIKPIAIRCVYDVFSSVNIPVIGCGGITCWQDAIAFIQAGASAIQIGTAVAFKGLNVFRSVANGIETYIKMKHFKNIKNGNLMKSNLPNKYNNYEYCPNNMLWKRHRFNWHWRI